MTSVQASQENRAEPKVAALRAALAARFPGVIHTLEDAPAPRLAPTPITPITTPPVARPVSAPPVAANEPSPRPVPLHSGQISEIVGSPGAGGCTLVLEHLAQALSVDPTLQPRSRRYATWVDLTGSFYPPAAAALGVPLEQLVLVRPSELHQALQALEIIVRGGAAHAVVLDVPEHTRPLRLATYHRLKHRVRESRCGLCVLTPRSIIPTPHRIELDSVPLSRVEAG